MTEAEAFKYLEKWRWPDGKPACPFCGEEAYVLKRLGQFNCKNKIKSHRFSVTNKTIFSSHKKPPQKCVEAIELVKSNPQITPVEFMRQTGWTYKGSWTFLERANSP